MDAAASSPALVVPVPPIAFVGPILIGGVFCYLLFGVLLVLVAQYTQTSSSKDRAVFKWLVGGVVAAQLVNLIFITENAWRVCVLGFLDPLNLVIPPITSAGTSIINGCVSFAVQLFFCWKIMSLGAKTMFSKVAAAGVLVCAIVQLGGAMGIGIQFALLNRDVLQMYKLKNFIVVHLTGSVICDLLITSSMVLILLQYKGNTAFVQTKSLLNTLIVHTVENGFITTAAAIANLAVYFLRTDDASNIAFQYVIGGLYAIVLLTALNRRQSGRRSEGPTSISLSDAENFGGSSRNNLPPNGVIASSVRPPPQFQVNVIRTMNHDGGSDYDDTAPRKSRLEPDIMVSDSKEDRGSLFSEPKVY